MEDWPVLAAITTAVVATAAGGALFRPDEWYQRLDKPSFTPPDYLFPLAWAVLYATIAASAYLYIRESRPDDGALALAAYAGQLVANALWSYFFFGRKRIDLAMVDLIVLAILILVTILLFAQASTTAALLLVPYFVWVCFAGVLNGSILLRNDTRFAAARHNHR